MYFAYLEDHLFADVNPNRKAPKLSGLAWNIDGTHQGTEEYTCISFLLGSAASMLTRHRLLVCHALVRSFPPFCPPLFAESFSHVSSGYRRNSTGRHASPCLPSRVGYWWKACTCIDIVLARGHAATVEVEKLVTN